MSHSLNQSLTHLPSLFDVLRTEAFASEYQITTDDSQSFHS